MLAITALVGIIKRGKYTFVIIFSFSIRLFAASVNALAKKCQGSNPVNTNKAYGTPSEGNFATLPNTSVNTAIVMSGRSTAQMMPIVVCL